MWPSAGALSQGGGQQAQRTERQLLQEAVNGGGKKGQGGQEEAPVNLADMHLFAKAYRRRVIVQGIISNEEGWREKVMALAEVRGRGAAALRCSALCTLHWGRLHSLPLSRVA